MKAAGGIFLIAAAFAVLWAQAPPAGAGAPQDTNGAATKGKGKTDPAAKGKGKGDSKATALPVPPAIPQVLRLLRPSTYLVTEHGTNSVFRVTPQGVVLVDTKQPSPGDYERLVELIRGISSQPVKYIVNTSVKPESSGNNAKFQAAGAEIVAGERTVKLDATEARSLKFGDATVVYFPADKLICLGDLYTSTNAAALDAVLKLDWNLAVPAAGEPVYRGAVEAHRKNLP